MALLCEVYAVMSQGDAPLSGVDKADAQRLCLCLTGPCKGIGIIS